MKTPTFRQNRPKSVEKQPKIDRESIESRTDEGAHPTAEFKKTKLMSYIEMNLRQYRSKFSPKYTHNDGWIACEKRWISYELRRVLEASR